MTKWSKDMTTTCLYSSFVSIVVTLEKKGVRKSAVCAVNCEIKNVHMQFLLKTTWTNFLIHLSSCYWSNCL